MNDSEKKGHERIALPAANLYLPNPVWEMPTTTRPSSEFTLESELAQIPSPYTNSFRVIGGATQTVIIADQVLVASQETSVRQGAQDAKAAEEVITSDQMKMVSLRSVLLTSGLVLIVLAFSAQVGNWLTGSIIMHPLIVVLILIGGTTYAVMSTFVDQKSNI